MTFEQWAWGRGFSLPQMDVAKMAWEAALKAQVGEPCPLCHAREVLVTTEIVGRQIDDLLNPTPEPVKAQAGEPVVFTQFLTDVITCAGLLSHGKRDKGLAKRISDEACRLMMSHPTTERRVFEWQGERKIAEHEYITTAFNYPEAPIGSRDWTLFWQGWQAALNAAPTPTKFQLGDKVRKTKGSQWHGKIVGTYSTSLTPEGYAVESSTEKGSVQIYPAAALEKDE